MQLFCMLYYHIWVLKAFLAFCRSGSAVKRSQTLAFGSPLGSQQKHRGTPVRRARRDGQRSSSGAKVGPSTAKRQKRKALLDILERVSWKTLARDACHMVVINLGG